MQASIRLLLEKLRLIFKPVMWRIHITLTSGRAIIIWHREIQSFMLSALTFQSVVCLCSLKNGWCVVQVKMSSSQGFSRFKHAHCWKIKLKLVFLFCPNTCWRHDTNPCEDFRWLKLWINMHHSNFALLLLWCRQLHWLLKVFLVCWFLFFSCTAMGSYYKHMAFSFKSNH